MGLSKDMWQPISTAPKDGTFVLLFSPERSSVLPCVGVYRFWWWKDREGEGYWLCGNDEYSPFSEPTHWMPLPEPPNDDN